MAGISPGAPTRDDLVALRKAGKTRDEIAAFYQVSLSRVKRWIKKFDIETAKEPVIAHKNARRNVERARSLGLDDGMTMMEKMHLILGSRLGEDRRGYLLDGRPARIDIIAKAAGLEIPEVNR